MADVDTLLSDIRAALEGVEEKIRGHPYLVALEKGEIRKEKLTFFAGEQYHIISSDYPRSNSRGSLKRKKELDRRRPHRSNQRPDDTPVCS